MSTLHGETHAVRDFMLAFEQTVRDTPTTNITDAERLLRARLIVEEAVEFAEAMGCTIRPAPDGTITAKTVQVDLDPTKGIDLVEAADAIADITVVNKGSGHALGVPQDAVFEVVHGTNMAKLGPDGRVLRRPSDGKVCKPEGWEPPTERIRALLIEAGWAED